MSHREAGIAILSITFFWFSGCGRDPHAPPSIMDQVRAAHTRLLIVDGRCDTAVNLARADWDVGERHSPKKRGSGQLDLPRMKEGGLDAAFFVAPVPRGALAPDGYAAAKDAAVASIERIRKMTEDHQATIGLALTPQDAYRLQSEGKLAAFIALGDGYALGRDLSLVEFFHSMGVRVLTLCGTNDNDICDAAPPPSASAPSPPVPHNHGLSDFGRAVVAECNRLGVIVDVSNCSEKAFFDVLAASRAPVIASHNGARALTDHPHNLTDEMIRALAANRGLVCVPLASEFLVDRPSSLTLGSISTPATETDTPHPGSLAAQASLSDFIDHMNHIVDLIGIERVGLSTVFDGGGGIDGCEEVSRMLTVTLEMLRHGYAEAYIEAVFGANLMRTLEQVNRLASIPAFNCCLASGSYWK